MSGTYIALFRAINVGGANALSMNDLARLLGSLGLTDVRTYIQSGNAVFRAAGMEPERLAAQIKSGIKRRHGVAAEVIVLTRAELASAVAANPYSGADANPKALHLTFLASPPRTPDLASLEKLRKDNEGFTLKEGVFYLYAPDGVGRSKLFARIEKSLGVVGTARNWRTVRKLLEMAEEMEAAGDGPSAAESRAGITGIVDRLPDARAVAHGSHLSLEVRKKRFAWYLENHHGDGRIALHCKSTADMRKKLRGEATSLFHTPKYLGQRGWVGLWLDVADVDWSLVEAALQEAYRLSAPKSLTG